MAASKAKFLVEQCERENRNYKPYLTYSPNYRQKPLTDKFYSQYYKKDLLSISEDEVLRVKRHIDSGPKEKHEWPETQNQWYGWFTEKMIEGFDNGDPFGYGRHISNFTTHEARVRVDKSIRLDAYKAPTFKLK